MKSFSGFTSCRAEFFFFFFCPPHPSPTLLVPPQMRVVVNPQASTSLRLCLNPRVCSIRSLHRGAALRQREHDDLSILNSSTDRTSRGQADTDGNRDKEKDDYYALLLSSTLRTAKTTPTNSISTSTAATLDPKLSPETSVPASASPSPSPRIVFGSRLAGPAARKKEGWGDTRPQEPDNCCMSGCVNCVWDTYREEVEEWAARQKQRQQLGQAPRQAGGRNAEVLSKVGSTDNGGVGDLDGMGGINIDPDAIFKDLPVGIKEFIATEKRLKERQSTKSDGELR